MRSALSEQCDYISDRNEDWEKHKVYDTESEANTALDGFFVQSQYGGLRKVGSSKRGVKTARLQVVADSSETFWGEEEQCNL